MLRFTLYKLLGIPDTVDEPTAYDLLDIEPSTCTPEVIDRALAARKKQLRQNIRSEKLLGVISFFGKELDAAARMLKDSECQQRPGADHPAKVPKARSESAQKPHGDDQADGDHRRRLVKAGGLLIREAMNADGTLDDAKRTSLKQGLRAKGLEDPEINQALDGIPSPGRASAQPTEEVRGFFARTIDTFICDGCLSSTDEAQLLKIATHFNVSRSAAIEMIDRRLPQRKARRVETGASTRSTDRESLGDRTRVRRRRVLMGGGAALLSVTCIAVVLWITTQTGDLPRDHTGPVEVSPSARPQVAPEDVLEAPAPAEPRTPQVNLARHLLDAARHIESLRQILDNASEEDLTVAISEALAPLVQSSHPDRAVATVLFKRLRLLIEPAKLQDVAMRVLMDHVKFAKDPAVADEAAWRVSSTLFLSEVPEAVELDEFMSHCRTAWDASLERQPSDPLHDPKRLSEAVVVNDAGALMSYSRWSDSKRFSAVTNAVADIASDPAQSGSAQAVESLQSAAMASEIPSWARASARFAMCRLLRQTPDESTAGLAVLAVCDSLNLDEAAVSGITRRPLDSPAARGQAAHLLESLLRGAVATFIKRTYSTDPNRTDDVLTDLALTMLACADKVARLTGGSRQWSADVLALAGAADRAERLTASVESLDLSYRDESAETDLPGMEISDDLVSDIDRLARQLRTDNAATRYEAISNLVSLNRPEANTVLLDWLEKPKWRNPTTFRILRELPQIDDTEIPKRLVSILENVTDSNRPAMVFAFSICQILDEGIESRSSPSMLPMHHTPQQRQLQARFWKSQLWSGTWGPKRRPISPNRRRGTTSVPDPGRWQPEVLPLKLVSMVSSLASIMARDLERFTWISGTSEEEDLGGLAEHRVWPGPNYEGEFLHAIQDVVEQLKRLVLTHPNCSQREAIRAGHVTRATDAWDTLCRTSLQRCAIRLEAAGDLLDILVELFLINADISGTKRSALDRIRVERLTRSASVANVIHELREGCYDNLVMLEMLTSQSSSSAPESTANDPAGAHRGDPVIAPTPPVDPASVRDGAEQRSQERQARREALGALANGLDLYLDGRYMQAGSLLRSACETPEVCDLARRFITRYAFADIVSRCEPKARVETASRCSKCGNTGQEVCRKCKGVGYRFCGSHKIGQTCPQCRALGGGVVCSACSDRGTVECRMCQRRLNQHDVRPPQPTTEAELQIRALADLARYLRAGGVDMYSPGALEPSPRRSHAGSREHAESSADEGS